MALNPPVPRLRLVQKRNNVAKLSLVVPAGDELVVSPAVADQLLASGDFVNTDAPTAAPAVEPDPEPAPADEAPKGKKKGVTRHGVRDDR